MRATKTQEGITVAAYAGTTGVLFAFDVEASLAKQLIGFAIQRRNPAFGRVDWLEGALDFPGSSKKPGELRPSNEAPIQGFRWSDFAVYPDQAYGYEIFPVYPKSQSNYPVSSADDLKLGNSVSIDVRTEPAEAGVHQIRFNRAAAASQAYARKFGGKDPRRNPRARRWLARGLDTHISQFIMKAKDPSWMLDVAIYEFELPLLSDALAEAAERGVRVRILYHDRKKDDQTRQNKRALASISGDNVTVIPRKTNSIFHHKFIVLSHLSEGKPVPEAVLTGSTNFTFNAVYYQANVAHAIWDRPLASTFMQLFEELAKGSSPSQTKAFNDIHNPISEAALEPVFSPRTNLTDLKHYIDIVKSARRSLLFCTAFDLHDDLEAALLGEDGSRIVRYGLQNTKSKITGYHREKAADFAATAFLGKGLEGFLKENLAGQKGRLLVHTKIILIDFDSNEPVLVTGSSNFSSSSSGSNDENAVVIRGNTQVADIYACEIMRLYTHYRFRYKLARAAKRAKGSPPSPPSLCKTDEWTKKYFESGTAPAIEREQFSRPAGAA